MSVVLICIFSIVLELIQFAPQYFYFLAKLIDLGFFLAEGSSRIVDPVQHVTISSATVAVVTFVFPLKSLANGIQVPLGV